MHGDLILFLFVLVFGCAAFFFGFAYLIGKLIGGLVFGVGRIFGWKRHVRGRPGSGFWAEGLVCPRPGCGKVEHRAARYCGQCGVQFPAPGVTVQR